LIHKNQPGIELIHGLFSLGRVVYIEAIITSLCPARWWVSNYMCLRVLGRLVFIQLINGLLVLGRIVFNEMIDSGRVLGRVVDIKVINV
jgi:hypothetical protein